MDHEKFKNIASGIQSLVVAAAVIVGGTWTAFVLGEAARSRAELDKLTHGQVALELSLITQTVTPHKGESRDLIVELAIKNVGAKYVTLDLREPSLQIRPITFDAKAGLTSPGPPISTHYYGPSVLPYKRLNLSTGASRVIPFLVSVPSPGIYLLTFESPMQKELALAMERLPAGANEDREPLGQATWVAQRIVSIQ